MLDVDDLVVSYGKVRALQDIRLRVAAGSITSIVGSNGAGKSTLLQTIVGHVRADSGDIRLNGEPILGLPAFAVSRKGIALVPEGRRLFANMTIEENLALGAYGVADRNEVAATLDWVYQLFPRLLERKRQVSGTLSGGEQQLLAIARGLMSRPMLMMLDEPSLGVMPAFVNRIFDVLAEIRTRGTTVLLVEQNVERSLQIADYAYVLQTGRLVLEGQGTDLLKSDLVRKAYLAI